jgi:hypothetical protein
MYETTMRLGIGIIRNGCSPVIDVTVNGDFFLDVINKFGISRQDLRKIKPSYDDLLEIYYELKYYGFSTTYYLKQKPLRA